MFVRLLSEAGYSSTRVRQVLAQVAGFAIVPALEEDLAGVSL
jgi:hypothetical protein